MINVRYAEKVDIGQMIDLAKMFHDDAIGAASPVAMEEMPDLFEELITRDHAVAIVASANGRIAGLIMGIIAPLWWNSGSTMAQDLALVVHPDFRGQGIGKALIEAFEDWAGSVGAQRVNLSFWPNNTGRAIEVATAAGFEPFDYVYSKEMH